MSTPSEKTPPLAWVWSHYRGIIETGPSDTPAPVPTTTAPSLNEDAPPAGTARAPTSRATGIAAAALLLIILAVLWLISS